MERDIRKRKGGGDLTDNGTPSPLAARLNVCNVVILLA